MPRQYDVTFHIREDFTEKTVSIWVEASNKQHAIAIATQLMLSSRDHAIIIRSVEIENG